MKKKNSTTTLPGRKNIFILSFTLLLTFTVAAQDVYTRPANIQNNTQTAQSQTSSAASDSLPRFYLGVGTGINNYVGIIGIGIDFRVHHSVFIRAGAGIGSWGTKVTIALRYELEQYKGRGWVLGLGFSHCSGLNNFQTSLAVDTSYANSNTVTKQVTLNLNPANTVNLMAAYNWTFHKHNKFYLEFGYALPLQSASYEVLDGSILDYSAKRILNEISPGGIILDLGFMFAL